MALGTRVFIHYITLHAEYYCSCMKLAGSPCGRGEGHCKSHEECAAVSLLSCIDVFILYISDCNIDQGLQCGNHNCRSRPMNYDTTTGSFSKDFFSQRAVK